MALVALAFACGALSLVCVPRPAHGEVGDQLAIDLGTGMAQVMVEAEDGTWTALDAPYQITPPVIVPDFAPATSTAPVMVARGADVTPLIYASAAARGANVAVLLRIATCESHRGTDPRTYRTDLTHRGPFQFNAATWAEQAPRYGYSGAWDAALDPAANVDVAAALIAAGQTWRWPNC